MGEAWINKYFTTNRAIAMIYRGGKSGQQRAMHRLIAGSFSVLAEEEQTVPQKITAFIRRNIVLADLSESGKPFEEG